MGGHQGQPGPACPKDTKAYISPKNRRPTFPLDKGEGVRAKGKAYANI